MKALTLYQPWATLVAIGAKRIETRSWQTRYRGPLAIHVSKNKKIDHNLWWSEPFASALEGTLVHIGTSRKGIFGVPESFITHQILTENLHYGCVIATCNLVACYPTADILRTQLGEWFMPHPSGVHWHISKYELAFGDFSPGRYMWFLSDVKLLPTPVPARGAMGLWEWEESA